jgi:hypothetical protein
MMNQDSSASVFWSLLCMRPAGSYLGHPNTWKNSNAAAASNGPMHEIEIIIVVSLDDS